jgi:hypothetical protein
VVLADVRGDDRFLRVTWHPASSTIVFSHWSGSVCMASTPVRLLEASRVIDLIVGALRDLAETGAAGAGVEGGPASWFDGLTGRFRPPLAAIRRLPGQLPSLRSGRSDRSGRDTGPDSGATGATGPTG